MPRTRSIMRTGEAADFLKLAASTLCKMRCYGGGASSTPLAGSRNRRSTIGLISRGMARQHEAAVDIGREFDNTNSNGLPNSEEHSEGCKTMNNHHRARAEKQGYISLVETARLLDVSTRTVETLQAKGKMPARRKFSRAYYYSRTDILALRETLARRARGQKTEARLAVPIECVEDAADANS